MSTELFRFLLGVSVLILATEIFIRQAIKISLALRISALIVGTTVVAMGTSLPELTVSAMAVFRQDKGLAIGNIVGSNIANVFLVMAVGTLLGKLRIGTTKTQRNAYIVLAATTVFLILANYFPPRLTGIILLSLAAIFTAGEYYWGAVGRDHEDLKQFKGSKPERVNVGMAALLLLALAGIIFGGITTVVSIENIAYLTGYSITILGLSLSAVATSLPELFITIFGEKQKQEKMVVGNIIGSNIYNLLLIGGTVNLLGGGAGAAIRPWEWLMFLAATAGLAGLVFYYKGRVVQKRVGVIFLALFFCYLSILMRNGG